MKNDNAKFDYEISHIIFKDKKGKEYLISKETIELWEKTFGLKRLESVDNKFVPNISQELNEFLEENDIYGIVIGIDSLLTITAKQYQNAIPQVKKVLKSPEMIIANDVCNNGNKRRLKRVFNYTEYILAKVINDKAYFLNMRLFGFEVTRHCQVSISNSRKKQKEFKKAIENGASYAVLNKENLIQKKLGLKLHEKSRITKGYDND